MNGGGRERRLLQLWRRLDEAGRRSLLDYAEFLAARSPRPPVDAPRPIPRPAEETVVAAMRRLRRTYPMVDPERVLHEAAALLSEHVLGGREAAEVIDALEALFERHYRRLREEEAG
ncbi:Crp/Fnr family transcriptional regulator [Inmirania thermothiophila]|uniref:Crp/Fnr family transcriptional regulator n=1 Tax=Inmirania thermothiophila TaxID=1750597 RepID=A0A3N1XT39_9GAMM|nr:Crp/Fnr family transcriptional regulator [Inmirania thermothiophila]ROR29816.1 hypothetical protein EDC57_2494 [Inmirania thermothiophila]